MKWVFSVFILLIGFFGLSDTQARPSDHDDLTSPAPILLGDKPVNLYCLQELWNPEIDGGYVKNSVALAECERVPLFKNGWACAKTFEVCGSQVHQKDCIKPGEKPFPDCHENMPGSLTCTRPLAECPDLQGGGFDAELIGKIGDIYFVNIGWNGGGSGSFSDILGVSFGSKNAPDDTLNKFVFLELGDKADGGLVKSWIEDNILHYSLSVTMWSFLNYVGLNFRQLDNPWGSVEGGHNSGTYARANYRLTPPDTKPAFEGMSAFGYDEHANTDHYSSADDSYWNSDYVASTPPQICLRTIMLKEEKEHNKTGYTPEQLKALGKRINETCLDKSKHG